MRAVGEIAARTKEVCSMRETVLVFAGAYGVAFLVRAAQVWYSQRQESLVAVERVLKG